MVVYEEPDGNGGDRKVCVSEEIAIKNPERSSIKS